MGLTGKVENMVGRVLGLICLVFFVGCATPGGTATKSKTRHVLYGTFQDFGWTQEFEGVEVIDESGSLAGIGWVADGHNSRLRVEVVSGNGDLSSPILPPGEKLDTKFTMLLFEIDSKFAGVKDSTTEASVDLDDVGRPLHAPSGLQPYWGTGVRLWTRELDALPGVSSSIDELWVTIPLYIGVDYSHWYAKDSRVFANLRGGASILNIVLTDIEGLSTVTNTPKPAAMFKFELGWEMDHLHLSLFADIANYSESSADSDFGLFIPDSEMTRLGLNIGYRW